MRRPPADTDWMAVAIALLMRVAVSLEELVVEARATNPSRTLRNLMDVMVQQEEKRRGS